MATKKFDLSAILTDVLKIGPRHLIGVDIGLNSVKICEMAKIRKGQYKMTKYVSIPLPDGCMIEDEIQKHDDIVEALKSGLKEGGFKLRNACLGMAGPNTLSKRLTLVSSEDLADQVMWESEQYIPFGVDESTISFDVIGESAGGGTDVLIAAARNDVVESFSLVCEEAGIKVRVADLQLFALANIFEVIKPEVMSSKGKTNLIIDFGAQKTSLIIIRDGAVVFTREMNMGGVLITEEIQRLLGLNYFEAEDLKIKGDEKGNLPQEIVEIIQSVMDSMMAEVKKTTEFFMTASSLDKIDRAFISGGNSLLPGLKEAVQGIVGCAVEALNPFEKISVNQKDFSQEVLHNASFRGLVAMGLALREIDK